MQSGSRCRPLPHFSGAVRCFFHTLALAVNDSVRNCNFGTTVLQRINCISAYLNTHTKVGAKLVQLQCVDFSCDRTVTLDKAFVIRWQSKFNAQEKYMVLRPYLARALPADAQAVLDPPVDDAVSECIAVLGKLDARPVHRKPTVECPPYLHHSCRMSCTARSVS